MNIFYILDEQKNPISVDTQTYLEWSKGRPKHVKRTQFKKYGITISTIFLAMNHYPFYNEKKPALFETMIFWESNLEFTPFQKRYSTWNEAIIGHREAVRIVIAKLRLLNKFNKKITIEITRS